MRYLLPLITLFSFSMFANIQNLQEPVNSLAPSSPHLVVNNKPLIKINNKVISLMDVVKKMNMIIHEHFPDVAKSAVAMYQFYDNQWKHIFEDMVFNELMLLDAEQKEIKVSDGDVREEMEKRFGPSIIHTLSKLKLQYDEVRDMIRNELIVRKIQGMKVYSKVQLTVTPERIKSSYEKYLTKNPPKETWKYQVLTVKGKNMEKCLEKVSSISNQLKSQNTKLSEFVKENKDVEPIQVSVSKEYEVDGKNLSEQHKKVLNNLHIDEYSEPICQTSRQNKAPVYRIFHLKSKNIEAAKSFEEKYDDLYNSLLDQHAKIERANYQKHLSKRFGIDQESIKSITSGEYQPFALQQQ